MKSLKLVVLAAVLASAVQAGTIGTAFYSCSTLDVWQRISFGGTDNNGNAFSYEAGDDGACTSSEDGLTARSSNGADTVSIALLETWDGAPDYPGSTHVQVNATLQILGPVFVFPVPLPTTGLYPTLTVPVTWFLSGDAIGPNFQFGFSGQGEGTATLLWDVRNNWPEVEEIDYTLHYDPTLVPEPSFVWLFPLLLVAAALRWRKAVLSEA